MLKYSDNDTLFTPSHCKMNKYWWPKCCGSYSWKEKENRVFSNCVEFLPSICFNLWTTLFNIYTWDIFNIYTWDIFNLDLYVLELKRGFPRNYRKTWNFNRWYLDTSYFTVARNCKKKSINGLIFMNTDSQSGFHEHKNLAILTLLPTLYSHTFPVSFFICTIWCW